MSFLLLKSRSGRSTSSSKGKEQGGVQRNPSMIASRSNNGSRNPGSMAIGTGGGQMQLQKRSYSQKTHQPRGMQQKLQPQRQQQRVHNKTNQQQRTKQDQDIVSMDEGEFSKK